MKTGISFFLAALGVSVSFSDATVLSKCKVANILRERSDIPNSIIANCELMKRERMEVTLKLDLPFQICAW